MHTSSSRLAPAAVLVATIALVANLTPAYAAPSPAASKRPDVKGQTFATAKNVSGDAPAAVELAKKMPRFRPSGVTSAASPAVTVQLDPAAPTTRPSLVQAGNLPVRVGAPPAARTDRTVKATAPAPAAVRVAITDPQVGRQAKVDSPVVSLSQAVVEAQPKPAPAAPRSGEASQVAVQVDLAALGAGAGGDWARRAHLVALPACAATTPDVAACRTQTPLDASRDGTTLTALVSLPSSPSTIGSTSAAGEQSTRATAVAAVAGPSGTSGDFQAAGSGPAARWTSGGPDGGFSWSYPLRVPAVGGGLEPDLSLDYSSSSIDGHTTSTNNQSSWVGDGWDLSLGSIERQYTTCADDTVGNNTKVRQDLCWAGDNATVSFGSHSGQLVQDKTTPSVWRLRDDDGTRFEKLAGAYDGGSYNREYWKATTNDGTQYFFGLGKGTPSATETTSSALQVPVYGNNPGEPCNQPTFAASSCQQTWRWNLDHVRDPDGNTITAYYAKETNRYGHDDNTGTVAYDRASSLARIDYGHRAGQEASKAPAQVVFETGARCVQSSSDCSSLTATSARYWYDVPQDQLCTSTSSCSGRVSPTFFSSTRLTKVRTQYYSGSAYVPVEQWSLTQTYPDPGDGTSPSLWLQNIQHTAGSVTVPAVTFAGTPLANRIAGVPDTREPFASALNKYRISKIATESGGEVDVSYLAPDCSKTAIPAAAETNTRRCFPVYWADSSAAPSLHWFDKWVVSSVVESDATGASATPVTTTYNYLGDPAWSYDDSKYIQARYRTWGQWEGYGKVQTLLGSDPTSDTAQRTDTLYYRGLDGDRLKAAGGTKTVTVTDSQGRSVPDEHAFAGDVREQITYNGLHGAEVDASINDDNVVATTAVGADGVRAQMADVTRTRTRTRLSDGSFRGTDQTTTFDSYGFETQTEDLGDVTDPADDTCDRTTYSRNVSAWLLDPVRTTQSRATTCAKWPATPTDDQVLDETRYYYDGKTTLGDVTLGHVTKVEAAQKVDGTGFDYYTESTSGYDSLGRAVSSTDELGLVSSTAYTPSNTSGVVQQVRTTTPDPDGSGPLAPHVTTATLDPRWGLTTATVGPDGSRSESTYDDLGRPTATWNPGRSKATDTPDTAYSYSLSNHAPSTVTTKTLLPNGRQASQISLLDGLLRPRQTQVQALDDGSVDGTTSQTSGRLIADTVYDDQGDVAETRGPTLVTGGPSTTLAAVREADIPSKTTNEYDGAGRVVRSSLLAGGVTKWSTTTAYGGDRVMVTPPAGGTATTTINDAEGRTTELREHTDGSTSGPYDAVRYAYTPSGDLASMTDALGNTWTHKYDLLGREIETNDPDAGKTVNTYDLDDQLLTTTDARGKTLAYTYDDLGRTTSLHDTTGTGPLRASWTYDTLEVGQQTSATRMLWGQPVTTRLTAVDGGGRPTASETSVPAIAGLIGSALAGTYKTSMTYNGDGSPKTELLPATGSLNVPEQLEFGYDDLGRPNSLLGAGPYVAGTLYSGYDDLLQTTSGRPGKSTFVTREFDKATGRLTHVMFDRASGASDEDVRYGYNAAGAVTKISTTQPRSSGAADTQCFNLDHLQRLTRAWTPSSGDCTQAPSAAALGGPAPYWTDWTFDKASNRTKQVRHAAAGDTTTTWTVPSQGAGAVRPHGATSTTVTPPGGTASTSNLTYDAAGNVTGRTSTQAAVLTSAATGETLTYDTEGSLATAQTTGANPTTVTHAYDADGEQLLRKDASSTTLYLGSTELKLDQATNTVKSTRYYDFAGQTVAVRTGTGSDDVSSLWSELNNTASWQVDWKTDTVTAKRTMPYGEPRDTSTPSASSLKGDHGFVGGTEDAALGLVNVGARDYDPASGRFLSVDPLIDLENPQTWNGYLYGGGNPVIHPDPSGLSMSSSHGSGCGGPHSENGCGGGNSHPVHHSASHKPHRSRPKKAKVSGHIRYVHYSHPRRAVHRSYGGGGHKRNGSSHHSHAAQPSKPKPPNYDKKYAAAAKKASKAGPGQVQSGGGSAALSCLGCGGGSTALSIGDGLWSWLFGVDEGVCLLGFPCHITAGCTCQTGSGPSRPDGHDEPVPRLKNGDGETYPEVEDPRTGEPISEPSSEVTRVPKDERTSWDGKGDRAKFIKEWYDRGYKTPDGGWENVEVHHIVPREFGGTNDFDNLVPLSRAEHLKYSNWWRSFGR